MTPYYQRLRASVVEKPKAEEPASTFTCPDCGREFGTEHGLRIHQTKTHAEEDAPF